MSNHQHRGEPMGPLRPVTMLIAWLAMTCLCGADTQPVTNLRQLTQALSLGQRISCDLDLEATVCAASRPKLGVLVLQDDTGVELLEVGDFGREILPGERVRLRGRSCLLRKREMGVEISALPAVSNDGLHAPQQVNAEATLTAGRIPLQVDWFNYWRSFALDVSWAFANEPLQFIHNSNLCHAVVTEAGTTNFLPGLRAECYEGSWDSVPEFNLLKSVKTVAATNLSAGVRSRDERVGVRFSGYLEVPRAGRYSFGIWSDDGALLFLGDPKVPVVSLGRRAAPAAKPSRQFEEVIRNQDERLWTVVEGRVSFVSREGEGVRFDLATDRQVITVRLADASGLEIPALLNSRVRIQGVGRGVMTVNQTLLLGRLFAASAADLIFLDRAPGSSEPALPITTVAQVQSLPIERARQALPVRIRGTVTGAMKSSQENWMSFQDETRGIFVRLTAVSNAAPAFGELWEVEGRSGAGDFAPIVVADQLTRLGPGSLPPPARPTWTELLNGSRDVQWAALQGLVTEVNSNTVSLHLPEGRLDVELEGYFEPELKPFLRSVLTIRGVLYAVWDSTTREVHVGRVMMRSPTFSVDMPAPVDPFDAVVRTPRELLLFDAQASAFRAVKVRGQVVHADAAQLFLQAEGAGLRLLPVEKPDVRPGDLIEAVGYPDIGRAELVLREAQLRKTGEAPMPAPRRLDAAELSHANVNSTRLRVEGKLLGWHAEQDTSVLEMQSGTRLYLARIAGGKATAQSLRPGSRLALEGVYVGRGNESFELLLNSPTDITVLSQPSWWTLPRLFTLVGVLLVILIFTMIWISQLRRLVEQRTHQLQRETRERERVERQHALEAERSRIARDLHDDLGASLTEISVLASTGHLPQTDAAQQPNLFKTISAKARGLISALDVIVWAVDPEDNSLQSLADYLSGYTDEFFSHTAIACRFKVPMSFPSVTLEGKVRHDLLLAVKEAFNNVVRHADATEVEFRMAMNDGTLEIDIADNGKGFDDSDSGDGHGIKNLAARLLKLGGTCQVESQGGTGTIVKIRLPIAAASAAKAT